MKGLKLADGRDRLVRHGHGPERTIQTGIGPVEVARVKIRDRAAAERWRADPLHLSDPSAVGAADEEPGRAFAGALPARHFDGRLPGGAGGTFGQERTELVTCGDFPADGRSGRASTSAGRSAICRRDDTSTSGPTVSFCRPAWKTTANACWC